MTVSWNSSNPQQEFDWVTSTFRNEYLVFYNLDFGISELDSVGGLGGE
jgi:hypothetical protein